MALMTTSVYAGVLNGTQTTAMTTFCVTCTSWTVYSSTGTLTNTITVTTTIADSTVSAP